MGPKYSGENEAMEIAWEVRRVASSQQQHQPHQCIHLLGDSRFMNGKLFRLRCTWCLGACDGMCADGQRAKSQRTLLYVCGGGCGYGLQVLNTLPLCVS